MEVGGMFLVEDDNKLGVYKNINDDIFTFKKYNLSDKVNVNSHGLIELSIDTSDVTLLGSANLPGQL